MSRNTHNRILDKYTNALKVYCDREDLDKAKRALEDVYQALDDLMEATKQRIKAREVKNVQRSEAQRPKETAKSTAPAKGVKSDPGPARDEVPVKKQFKPRNVSKKSK